MFAYHIGKTDHGISSAKLRHSICILLKMREKKKEKKKAYRIEEIKKNRSEIGYNMQKKKLEKKVRVRKILLKRIKARFSKR